MGPTIIKVYVLFFAEKKGHAVCWNSDNFLCTTSVFLFLFCWDCTVNVLNGIIDIVQMFIVLDSVCTLNQETLVETYRDSAHTYI